VYAYITEGSLRHVEELRPMLIEYVNRKEELFRRGRLGDTGWEFTVRDLWELGKRFGLAGPPPPPTDEEIAAHRASDRAKREADEESDRQIEAELEAAQREFGASPEGQ